MAEQERPSNKQGLILLKITSPVLKVPQAVLDFSNEELGSNRGYDRNTLRDLAGLWQLKVGF